MEGSSSPSTVSSQQSLWILAVGGVAIAATAAAVACAATLYINHLQILPDGYRSGRRIRRHKRHDSKVVHTNNDSSDSSISSGISGSESTDVKRRAAAGSPNSSPGSQRQRQRHSRIRSPLRGAALDAPAANGGTHETFANTQKSFGENRINSNGSIPAVSRLGVATGPQGKAYPPRVSSMWDQLHRTKRHAGSVRRDSLSHQATAPGSDRGRTLPGAGSSFRPPGYFGGGMPPDGDGSTLLPREQSPVWHTERGANAASLRLGSGGSSALPSHTSAAPGPVPGHGVPGTVTSAPGHAPAPSHHLSTASDLINEGQMQEEAALHEQYTRVITPEPALNEETEDVCGLLKQCYDLRDKWLFQSSVTFPADEAEVASPSDLLQGRHPFEFNSSDPQTQPSEYDFEMKHGVVTVWTDSSRTNLLAEPVGTSHEFFSDMHRMMAIQAMGAVRSFCFHRLELLGQKFNLHVMMNADKEFLAQKSAPHRDFYNVRKVDTHIHHSACMHQKHLLRFIKSKLRKEPDQVVIFRDGKFLTLAEVFESLKMTGHDLNVDTLDMHADKNIFHRFDKFNLKYNPCGQSRLREIFIKQDNIIHGRFLAELTQEVVDDLEASKYQHAELRISVYGRKKVEWDILAAWIVQHNLYSDNVVWLIQIPRLYAVYKEQGIIANFEEMLDHLFSPLFEVTRDPTSHPQLHLFLKQVVGFDMVDDESKPERRPNKHMPMPDAWDLKHNPAYSYYAFYTYANLYTLNKFREARGLNTFTFRPHAGEAGDIDHLASAFMLCENIAHGINLRKSPVLQYLFYLKQIGLCMSPLSNNSLFLDYHRNPLPTFFARGLNVSLSTDDPLQIHLTKEPLVEEYSVAAQVWKLSATDLCEIARSSVLHSGFPHQVKMHWVHQEYWRMGPEGNDIQKTNVPNLRMRFRAETFMEELSTVMGGAAAHSMRLGARSS